MGPVANGPMAAGAATMGDRASIEKMVQEALDHRLARAGPRRWGPEGMRERPSGGTPIRPWGGLKFGQSEADTVPEAVF